MSKFNGRNRVIITNVSPQVEGGRFPAKAIVEEHIVFSADIFCDGHDEMSACLYIKKEPDADWQQRPLTLINNDHWECTVQLPEMGKYQYRVAAWIDHFETWRKGLKKKYDAGQDVKVELQIGAGMIADATVHGEAKGAVIMQRWAKQLNEGSDTDALVALALSAEVAEAMAKNAVRPFITEYPVTFTIEAERKKAAFSAWYELFPRSASQKEGKHGTFKDVIALLPRIANMGFDTMYFPPIHPIGTKNRKGKNNSLTAEDGEPGSPWAIGNKKGGHKAIHPELGTLKDFKNLAETAKKYNLEIAMDIAFQCAPDHPYVKQHPQWFNWRPDGTVQYAENPPKKYEDILPINFESDDWENLWDELKSVFTYWIDNGITIFRIDNPHTKAFPFWEWVINEIRTEHPDVIFLAEAFTSPRKMERLGKGGFNQSYTYFTWRNTKAELEEYMTELTKTDMRYYYRPNFWPNTPDILPPELTAGGDNAHIIRVLLAATLSSSYGIYGPVYEFGINTPRPGKEEYIDNEKYEIRHWDWNKETRIGEYISLINRIRKENPALHSTWNITFAKTSNEHIICYVKTDKQTGNRLIIAVNIDPNTTQEADIQLPLKELDIEAGQAFAVHDLLSGDTYQWRGEWNYVKLNPYETPAHILKLA